MKNSLFIAITILMGLLLAQLGYSDSAAHNDALYWLKPIIETLSYPGKIFLQNPSAMYSASAGVAMLLLCIFVIISQKRWRIAESREPLTIVALLLFSAFLQLLSIRYHSETYLWMFVSCAPLFLIYFGRYPLPITPVEEKAPWSSFALPFVILLVAAVFRFYALNVIHPNFEGELSPYYLGATSFRGIVLANEGMAGPWAPLGYLFYPPLYLTIKIFGSTTYAIRVASALVSLFTYALLYVLTAKLFGKRAGVIALSFLALDCLQIGWSRTDVHPHGVTTWITLLVMYTTFAARLGSARLMMSVLFLLQIVSWQQYPSGQTAALLPLISFFLAALFKAKEVDYPWRKTLITFIGVLAWFFAPILLRYGITGELSVKNYFERLGPRVDIINLQERSTNQIYWQALQDPFLHLSEIIRGIFFEARELFHQDIILPVPGWAIRTVNFTVAIGAFWGLVLSLRRLRRFEHLLLLVWIGIAMIPAIFSEAPYPKRCATLFPALMLTAGVAYSHAFGTFRQFFDLRYRLPFHLFFICGLVFASCISSAQWFSGFSLSSSTPLEEQIVQSVSQSVKPKTCIVVLTTDNYAPGKFSYLLSDTFSDTKLASLGLSISVMNQLPDDFEFNELLRKCSETIHDPLPFYRLWGPTEYQQFIGTKDSYWSSLLVIIGPIFSQDKDHYLQSIHAQRSQAQNHFFYSTSDQRQYLVLLKTDLTSDRK